MAGMPPLIFLSLWLLLLCSYLFKEVRAHCCYQQPLVPSLLLLLLLLLLMILGSPPPPAPRYSELRNCLFNFARSWQGEGEAVRVPAFKRSRAPARGARAAISHVIQYRLLFFACFVWLMGGLASNAAQDQ